MEQTQEVIKREGENESSDDTSYRPRTQLGHPIILQRTLAWLMNGLDNGFIDVDPDYQREVVWTADRMSGLVDSLMENYYIPPIILNKKKQPTEDDDAPKFTLVCVDGKQRLSSVKAFVNGMIHCHDQHGEKWYFCEYTPESQKRRRVLPEVIRLEFLAKQFVSFEFENISAEQEEDLFSRVQKGVQLTAAEKMRATTGPWQELAQKFVRDFPDILGLLKDPSRSKDFQIILSSFNQIVECQHPSASTGVPTFRGLASHVTKFVSNKDTLDEGLKSHLGFVFRIFNELIQMDPTVFTNVERKLKRVQTFAPIELVAIAVLISQYADTRNKRLLLGDIRYFRDYIREHFADLRSNEGSWKFIWEFIDNLEQHRGAVDGSTLDQAENESERTLTAPQDPTHTVPRSRPTISPSKTSIGTSPTLAPASAAPGSPAGKRGRPALSNTSTTGFTNAVVQPSSSTEERRQRKRPRVETSPTVMKEEPRRLSSFIPLSTSPSVLGNIPRANTLGFTSANAMDRPLARRQLLSRPAEVTPAPLTPTSATPESRQTKLDLDSLKNKITNTLPLTSSSSTLLTGSAPKEVPQNRIPELNSFRAPVAPMGMNRLSSAPSMTAAPTTSAMLPFHTSGLSPSSATARPVPTMSPTTSVSTISPVLPFHTYGISPSGSYSVSPRFPPALIARPLNSTGVYHSYAYPTNTGNELPTTTQNSRAANPASRAMESALPSPVLSHGSSSRKSSVYGVPQSGGAIDLTSDDPEHERQELLSSFRGPPKETRPSDLSLPWFARSQAPTGSALGSSRNMSILLDDEPPVKPPSATPASKSTTKKPPGNFVNPYKKR